MSKEKFTQGEWLSDGCFVESENGECIVSDVFIASDEELKSNANLISAAPDMYRALLGLMDLESRGRVMPIGKEWDAARAAIEKADGEKQCQQ